MVMRAALRHDSAMNLAPVRIAPAGAAAPTPAPDRPASRAVAGADRLRRHNWWSLIGLVYVVGAWSVAVILVEEPTGALNVATAVAAAAATVGAAQLLHRRFPSGAGAADGDESVPVGLIGLAVAGGLGMTVGAQWFFEDPTWAMVPGLATGGLAVTASRRHRLRVVVVAALVTGAAAAAAQYAAAGTPDPAGLAGSAAAVAVFGGLMVYGLWSFGVIERLDQARRLESELAVADERLRFAADLHDIQGHHLQVIALKSELAARLAETDPATAVRNMGEVQEHARTALQDTRAVVQGYRHTSVSAELDNAARVLAAAGIDGQLQAGTDGAGATIPDAQRNLLGLVTREATTNLLRHSHATRARLALETAGGWAVLRFRNDGAAGTEPGHGTGLTGLAGRFDVAGGTLDWGREGQWFTVTARLPLVQDYP